MLFPTSTIGILALLGAAQAAPSQRPQRTLTERQTVSTSKGFKLYAEGYGAPGETYWMNYQRIGQGFYVTTVTPDKNSAPVFWEDNIYKTQVYTDQGGFARLGLVLQNRIEFDSTYTSEHQVNIIAGSGAWLQVAAPNGEPFAHLSGLIAPPHGDISAQYMICEREVPLGGAGPQKLKVVRTLYSGETAPDDCVVVQFEPACDVLKDLPADASWNHDHAVNVQCNPLL